MTTSTSPHALPNQAADALISSKDKVVDTTRNSVNHALNVVDEKIDTLRGDVKPTVDKLTHKAEHYVTQGIDMAVQAKDKAKESLSHYSEATSRYVAEKPVQSILIAAATGAAVALLVSSLRNRSRY